MSTKNWQVNLQKLYLLELSPLQTNHRRHLYTMWGHLHWKEEWYCKLFPLCHLVRSCPRLGKMHRGWDSKKIQRRSNREITGKRTSEMIPYYCSERSPSWRLSVTSVTPVFLSDWRLKSSRSCPVFFRGVHNFWAWIESNPAHSLFQCVSQFSSQCCNVTTIALVKVDISLSVLLFSWSVFTVLMRFFLTVFETSHS